MALFSPWAFGTTQPWSIWTMNCAGYILGVLLAVKLAIRRLKGYHPGRWKTEGPIPYPTSHIPYPIPALIVLTVAILGYCLVGALNARSTWHPNELTFAYHQYIKWLPHSFDSTRTWVAFWSYLALACSFWALRDWLLGKTVGEQRAEHQPSGHAGSGPAQIIPARLRRLLWLLAVNGALLGLESVAQRLEGSGKLLFIVKPQVNPAGETQFGPYAYRANASQYFNLLWPVCLGFWWTLQRASGFKRKTHHLLQQRRRAGHRRHRRRGCVLPGHQSLVHRCPPPGRPDRQKNDPGAVAAGFCCGHFPWLLAGLETVET